MAGDVKFYSFDQAYVSRLREGDSDTEGHFVSYFTELLNIKLRSRVLPPELVDEVRQETFTRVLTAIRRRNTLERPESLGAFVNSVCNNVLLEASRSSARCNPLPCDLDPPDRTINLDGALISEEVQRHVRDVLARLSRNDRELLRAVILEEKDKDQVCDAFGVNRDYLRVLVHRAKQRFKESYLKG